jgi:hypothetical protein
LIDVGAWLTIALALVGVLVWRLRSSLGPPEKRPIALRFALVGSAFYGVIGLSFALGGAWILAAGHLLLFAMFFRFAILARRALPAIH